MRSLATSDSTHPTAMATAAMIANVTDAASAVSFSGSNGLSSAAIRPAYIVILRAAAYCIAASAGPL